MHELSIALSILEFAEEEAEKRGTGIEAIHVRVGPLSGVVKDALLSAYELARENTSMERARLVIEEVPIEVYCPHCEQRRPVHSMQRLCCRECDTPATEVVQGRELQVVALELTS